MITIQVLGSPTATPFAQLSPPIYTLLAACPCLLGRKQPQNRVPLGQFSMLSMGSSVCPSKHQDSFTPPKAPDWFTPHLPSLPVHCTNLLLHAQPPWLKQKCLAPFAFLPFQTQLQWGIFYMWSLSLLLSNAAFIKVVLTSVHLRKGATVCCGELWKTLMMTCDFRLTTAVESDGIVVA